MDTEAQLPPPLLQIPIFRGIVPRDENLFGQEVISLLIRQSDWRRQPFTSPLKPEWAFGNYMFPFTATEGKPGSSTDKGAEMDACRKTISLVRCLYVRILGGAWNTDSLVHLGTRATV